MDLGDGKFSTRFGEHLFVLSEILILRQIAIDILLYLTSKLLDAIRMLSACRKVDLSIRLNLVSLYK